MKHWKLRLRELAYVVYAYILPITFILLTTGQGSAQAIVIRTTDVIITDELCDSTVLFLELDCVTTIVGNTMTLTQGGNPTEIIKVWYTESVQEAEGILRIYEHDTGFVYINTEVPYVIIEDEAGCVHYFNNQ